MNQNLRRTVTIAAIAAVIAGSTSGCFMLPTAPDAASDTASDAASDSASKTPDATPEAQVEDDVPPVVVEHKGEPGTLSYADGDTLVATGFPQWLESLAQSPDWTLTTPDTGQGAWQYTSIDAACTTMFWQGEVYDMTATDDVAASDIVLATILDIDVSQLAGFVTDTTIGHIFTENPTADVRYIEKITPERSWVVVARGFAQLTAAGYIIVDCQGEQAHDVAAGVLASSAIGVLGQ